MAYDQRYSVQLAKSAEADLQAINDYLCGTVSPAFANQVIDQLLDKIDSLEQFPERGFIPLELQDMGTAEYRQLLFKPYRLFYRIMGSSVIITIIADGRRDIKSLVRQRLLPPRK